MNRISLNRRTQIINCLVEGNSIRSTERLTNTHRDTIMRLMVEVGDGCAKLMDEKMRDLSCQRLQVDEIWSYVGKKQAQLKLGDDRSRLGDQWTFVALDPDTKLVPTHRVGKRTRRNAVAFMNDLSGRLANRVQISSDALTSYVDAVEQAFGADVDYGKVVKFYDAEPIGPGRYAPPRVVSQQKGRGGRKPRPTPHFYELSGASKFDDAHVHAPFYTANQCVQQEGGEPSCGCITAFYALQFRAHTQDATLHPRYGSWS